MSSKITTDILIIGGGIIGATVARSLSMNFPSLKISLLEKESSLGQHTSTRNSSVIHAGIYYHQDSLKAKFCKQGNEMLTKFCQDNKLPLKNTGKFVVANTDDEYGRLKELLQQTIKNEVAYEWLTYEQAKKIEPYLRSSRQDFNILFTPQTKVGDNKAVIQCLQFQLAQIKNVSLHLNTKFIAKKTEKDYTSVGAINIAKNNEKICFDCKYIINCGGVYADKIAKEFGLCQNYTIIPYKGRYLYQSGYNDKVNSLIYPVPPVKGNHFVGVHLTCTPEGKLKLGPNAMTALWREQYKLNFDRFSFTELMEVIQENAKNFFGSKSKFYLKHVKEEGKKLYRPYTLREAMKLSSAFDDIAGFKILGFPQGAWSSFSQGNAGIRAQLINLKTRDLVHDFIIENDQFSMHLLNLVSPGWTCSLPIAEHITQQIKNNKIFNYQ